MPSSDGSTPYICKQTGCVYGYRGRTDHGAKTLRVEVTIRPSWDRSVVPWLPRSHAGPFGDRHIPQRWRETCALITYDPWATRMLVPPGRPGLCLSLKGPDVTPGVTHPISVGGNFSELRKGPPRGCLNSHSAYRPVNLNGTLPLATSVMTSERMNGVLLLVCLMATTIFVVSGPGKRSTLLAPRGLPPRGSCEYPIYQYAALLPTRTTGARPVDIWGIKTPRMPFKSKNNEQKPPILTPKLARSSRTGVPAWDIFKPLSLAQIELVFHDS